MMSEIEGEIADTRSAAVMSKLEEVAERITLPSATTTSASAFAPRSLHALLLRRRQEEYERLKASNKEKDATIHQLRLDVLQAERKAQAQFAEERQRAAAVERELRLLKAPPSPDLT